MKTKRKPTVLRQITDYMDTLDDIAMWWKNSNKFGWRPTISGLTKKGTYFDIDIKKKGKPLTKEQISYIEKSKKIGAIFIVATGLYDFKITWWLTFPCKPKSNSNCDHMHMRYYPDPSGNNDSYYECLKCGREIRSGYKIKGAEIEY